MDVIPRGEKQIYHARYLDETGRRISKSTGETNRKAAEKIGILWEEESRQIRKGSVDHVELEKRRLELRPIAEHLDAYEAHQRTKDCKPRTIRFCRNLYDDFCTVTGAGKNIDLVPARLHRYLDVCRKKDNSTVTLNGKIVKLKSLTKWMLQAGRIRKDPLQFERIVKNTTDPRSARRPPTTEEVAYLLAHTIAKGQDAPHMTGPQRALMYLTALITGYRAGELAQLVREDFDLETLHPVISARANYTKNRKEAVQPIHGDICASISELVDNTPKGKRVFYGAADNKPGKLLRKDLESARAAWLAESKTPEELWERTQSDFLKRQNARGEWLHFHSLRHKYINDLSKSGVPVDFIRKLARHSSIKTTERYLHTSTDDTRQFVPSMPVGVAFTAGVAG